MSSDVEREKPQRLLDQAVAFHEAGARCYAERPTLIAPEGSPAFLGGPTVVCFAFALELYLKLLLLLTVGKIPHEHNLAQLHAALPADAQALIERHYSGGYPDGTWDTAVSEGWDVGSVLKEIATTFTDWRYAHEHRLLVADPRHLQQLGTAMHRAARERAPGLISTFERSTG